MGRIHLRTSVKPPSGLSVGSPTSSTLTLTWSASPAAFPVQAYFIERSADGSTGWTVVGFTSATTFTDTLLDPVTTYFYRVRTEDTQLHFSAYTASASATTLSAGGAIALFHGQTSTITTNRVTLTANVSTKVLDHGQDGVGNINAQWAFREPRSVANSVFNLNNKAQGVMPSGTTINGPHARTTVFLSGTHYGNPQTADGGLEVDFSHSLNEPAFPYYWSATLYSRADPNWDPTITSTPADANYKELYYNGASGSGPSGAAPFWYLARGVASPFDGTSGPVTTGCNFIQSGGGGGPTFPDLNGHGSFYQGVLNPMHAANGWIKRHYFVKMAQDTTGYIKVFENGVLVVDYRGQTAFNVPPNTGITFTMGGYSRMYGSPATPATKNARYFADIYPVLSTVNSQQIVMTDAPTWAGSTKFETCPIVGGAGGSSVQIQVNGGGITAGPCYLWAWNPVNNAAPVALDDHTYTLQDPATFDFYVSPTGNNANAGTSVSAPWAITSLVHTHANYASVRGKRVGFMPGTYDVSSMYFVGDSKTGCFQIDGGPDASHCTTYASCDASGNYSRGTALIKASTPAGAFGGDINALPAPPVLSHTNATAHCVGNIVIDGLRFTGYSWKCIRIGGLSSGDAPVITGSVTVQNCEFFGAGQNAGSPSDNMPSIWLDGLQSATAPGPFLITNNYFHDNIPQNPLGQESITCVQVWRCWGVQITFNTCVKSGGFNGKIDSIQGSTIAYNYMDNSAFSASGQVRALDDWTGNPTAGLTQTSNFHHNIFIVGGWGIECQGTSVNAPWTTPVNVYNNTIVLVNGGPYPAIMMGGTTNNAGQMNFYNNLVTGAADGSGYKTFRTSPKAIGIFDYNGHMTAASFNLFPDGTNTESAGVNYTSDATFAAGVVAQGGVAGVQAHAVSNSSPLFTGTGTFAAQYQLQAASPFAGRGSTNGTAGGSPTDMGAWGNGATQIGASWVT